MNKKGLFQGVDKTVFIAGSIVAIAFILFIGCFTDTASVVVTAVLDFVMERFGWLYLLVSLAVFIFCLFLCFSKYGRIKIGKEDDKPEYSTPAWLAMLYSAAMGVAIIFFGVSEPVQLTALPPIGESNTVEGCTEALKYVFFQNGLSMWALYALVGVALGYFSYRKGLPQLPSATLTPIFGEKRVNGGVGKTTDTIALISTIFGISAAISVCTTQLMTGLQYEFGIEPSMLVQNIIILCIAVAFLLSCLSGVAKGIKTLSTINVYIVVGLILYVFVVGPFTWICRAFLQWTGAYLQNFIDLATFTDIFGTMEANTGYDFIGSYPIMYVAWYMAWTCFVGSFVARISKGRTIRATIIGTLLIPGMFGLLWFVAFGGTAIQLDFFQNTGLSPIIQENAAAALFALFNVLPGGKIFAIPAFIVIFTLIVTTCDSSTLVAAIYTCRGSLEEPRQWVKMYFGVIIALVAAVFLPIGGVQVSRQLCLIFAMPITAVCILEIISLWKAFKTEEFTLNKYGKFIPKE